MSVVTDSHDVAAAGLDLEPDTEALAQGTELIRERDRIGRREQTTLTSSTPTTARAVTSSTIATRAREEALVLRSMSTIAVLAAQHTRTPASDGSNGRTRKEDHYMRTSMARSQV